MMRVLSLSNVWAQPHPKTSNQSITLTYEGLSWWRRQFCPISWLREELLISPLLAIDVAFLVCQLIARVKLPLRVSLAVRLLRWVEWNHRQLCEPRSCPNGTDRKHPQRDCRAAEGENTNQEKTWHSSWRCENRCLVSWGRKLTDRRSGNQRKLRVGNVLNTGWNQDSTAKYCCAIARIASRDSLYS